MRLKGLGFRDAIAYLAVGVYAPVSLPESSRKPGRKGGVRTADPKPDAMTNAEAEALVADAEGRLWSEEGGPALEYLRGRGLADGTIRGARLGWTPRAMKVAWTPPGLVLPWIRNGLIMLVKVRPDESFRRRFEKNRRPPKYLEGYRHPWTTDLSDPPVYPALDAIRAGVPLVVTEGEMDCLLLGQVLGDMAAVITLGGAAFNPGPSTLSGITPAWPRYCAQDDDAAGDKAAARWPASFRRLRPPGAFHRDASGAMVNDKDWGDAFAQGIDLARWWGQVLDGKERPPLFTPDELERRNPPEPVEPWTGPDPYDAMEREAIQWAEQQGVAS